MVVAINRQDWAASLGDVASVASMVLGEKIFDLISHVVAPAISSNLQMARALSYVLSVAGAGAGGAGLVAGCGVDGVRDTAGGFSLSSGTDSATGLPSSVCPLIAPTGHDEDSCCVMTTPLGMVHLTWASAGKKPAAKVAMQMSFENFTDISYVPRRLKGRMTASRKLSMLGSVLCGDGRFFKRSKQPHSSRPVFFREAFQDRQRHRAWVAFAMHFCDGRWRIHPTGG